MKIGEFVTKDLCIVSHPPKFVETDLSSKDGVNLQHMLDREHILRYSKTSLTQEDLIYTWNDSTRPPYLPHILMAAESIDEFNRAYTVRNNPAEKSNLERVVNEKLKKISRELNTLLCDEEDSYRISAEFESDGIRIHLYRNEIKENLDYQSEGFLWVFKFLTGVILNNNHLKTGDIILIDNFGESLHCGTVKNIIPILRKVAKKTGITFVLATQSPTAIDIKHLDEIRLIIRQPDGRSIIFNNFCMASCKEHDTIEPILNALTISRNYMRTENRKTIFVEGITDYYYLNAFCEVLRSKKGDCMNADIDFIPINGVGGQGKCPETLAEIKKIDPYPIILVDNDKRGREFRDIADGEAAVFTLSNAIPNKNIENIEDLFHEEDQKKYNIKAKHPNSAAIFAQKLDTIYNESSEDTRENFKTLIKYTQRDFWTVTAADRSANQKST